MTATVPRPAHRVDATRRQSACPMPPAPAASHGIPPSGAAPPPVRCPAHGIAAHDPAHCGLLPTRHGVHPVGNGTRACRIGGVAGTANPDTWAHRVASAGSAPRRSAMSAKDAAAVETFWCSYLYLLSTILIQIATQKNAREQNTHGRHYGPPPVALPAASGLAISPLSESQITIKTAPLLRPDTIPT